MTPKIIDTSGQWTPIITGDYDTKQRAKIGKGLLSTYSKAGQIAFIEKNNKVRMMGDELSINGSIAAGYYLARENKYSSIDLLIGKSQTSIPIDIKNKIATARFKTDSLVKKVDPENVQLDGIAYSVLNQKPSINNLSNSQFRLISKLSKNNPASGIIFSQGNRIWPVIYVRATNSLIWETACGSGTLAYYLITGIRNVVQPSNQVIKINESSGTLSITVNVKEISP